MEALAEPSIQRQYERLGGSLHERGRRLWVAAEARQLGRGGVSTVARARGLSRTTISQGMDEVHPGQAPGGGRKPLTVKDPRLRQPLQRWVDPVRRGDPESPLPWTCKSTRQRAQALASQGHPRGRQKVAPLRAQGGYRLQAHRKAREGREQEGRDAQFDSLNRQVKDYQSRGQPGISVDTKKKQWVGDFKNAGRQWPPQGQPQEVRTHDCIDRDRGKVPPYGGYNQSANAGGVSVGTDPDPAEFAGESLRRGGLKRGCLPYPQAHELLITAEGGGSQGYRVPLGKVGLQTVAHAPGLTLRVCHVPPGTRPGNKSEPRMCSFISLNGRGKPLISHEVVVKLIGSPTTRPGLTIHPELDTTSYPSGGKVTDQDLGKVHLIPATFHGEGNSTIAPNCSG